MINVILFLILIQILKGLSLFLSYIEVRGSNAIICSINSANDLVEMLLYVAGSILSAILVALSIVSYYRYGLKKLVYATIAFLLFGIFLIYESLEHLYSLDNPFTDIVIPLLGLAIILFFFLVIVKKVPIKETKIITLN